jgi:transcriptional regulator with PAS, ATPase and Fis domain
LSLLKLRYADMATTNWAQLFDQNFHALLSRQRRIAIHPEALYCRDGSRLFMQVHSQSRIQQTNAVKSKSKQDLSLQHQQVDPQWLAASSKAEKIIDKAIPLLVQGESGVGKEVFAQAVHQSSNRRDKAFVAVNCAAIPEHLIEAELFGYVAGAFTGASRQGALGRLREAHGGTLFLDEIGDMPLALQTRLLRVLQERQVTPLGSSAAIPVDFNLICATHQNLKQCIEQGRFREDLYYRINGLSLRLPALRERTDFVALCTSLLQEWSPRILLSIQPDLLRAMQTYNWPGNLRQLSHVLRAAVALLDDDQAVVDWEHLADDLKFALKPDLKHELERELRHELKHELTHERRKEWQHALPRLADQAEASKVCTDSGSNIGSTTHTSATQNLQQHARHLMQQALADANGNVSAAARALGISRQTLYRKLQAQ